MSDAKDTLNFVNMQLDRAAHDLFKQLGPAAQDPSRIESALAALAMGLGTERGSAAANFAAKSEMMYKSGLDVGSLTDLATVTGGQSLGYVSLDTHVYRTTVRPNNATLYYKLPKSAAKQIVDFWPTVTSTGGALPGSAYKQFSNVYTQSLTYNSGKYDLNTLTLKLAYDARAITQALAVQDSFASIGDQETANAALSVLETLDWTLYWGNGTLYGNQPTGLYQTINGAHPEHVFDFYSYNASNSANTQAQNLFNMMYLAAAETSGYGSYAMISDAFMSPNVYAMAIQTITAVLNNVINLPGEVGSRPLVVNADQRGIDTGFGLLQFEGDLFIPARNKPAQAMGDKPDGSSYASTSNPTPPTSATCTVAATDTTGEEFDSTYGGKDYYYAVAAVDSSMNESELTWVHDSATTPNYNIVPAQGGMAPIVITPADGNQVAFRIYRSAAGAPATTTDPSTGNAVTAAGTLRFIGEIASNGTNAVTFTDYNSWLPGSEPVFLLDMYAQDQALDYRYLLPMSRINLFANQLFLPWAVAHIGAPRVTKSQFHAVIKNVVPPNTDFDPLSY